MTAAGTNPYLRYRTRLFLFRATGGAWGCLGLLYAYSRHIMLPFLLQGLPASPGAQPKCLTRVYTHTQSHTQAHSHIFSSRSLQSTVWVWEIALLTWWGAGNALISPLASSKDLSIPQIQNMSQVRHTHLNADNSCTGYLDDRSRPMVALPTWSSSSPSLGAGTVAFWPVLPCETADQTVPDGPEFYTKQPNF